ncbi:MAG: TadE/TadG family type IV pilus assembly protein [Phycisphaeraceae bacterium]
MTGLSLLAQLSPTPHEGWWWSTLTSGPALTLLGVALGCVLVLVYLGVRLRRVSATQRVSTARQRLADDSGVAMIEFVLVTPILLGVTLLLIQTTLVFTGLFYVQYAAFAGARSAIVQVPMHTTREPTNTIYPVEGSEKYDAIRASAALAVMPVSGREDAGAGVASSEVVAGVRGLYAGRGEPVPAWVDRLLAGRLSYAVNHTEVVIEKVRNGNDAQTVEFEEVTGLTEFGPKDAISVRVQHEFALTVPLANAAFQLAGGRSGSYSPASGSSAAPPPPGRWTLIEARAILTNEGIDRRLPEKPPADRR